MLLIDKKNYIYINTQKKRIRDCIKKYIFKNILVGF